MLNSYATSMKFKVHSMSNSAKYLKSGWFIMSLMAYRVTHKQTDTATHAHRLHHTLSVFFYYRN